MKRKVQGGGSFGQGIKGQALEVDRKVGMAIEVFKIDKEKWLLSSMQSRISLN